MRNLIYILLTAAFIAGCTEDNEQLSQATDMQTSFTEISASISNEAQTRMTLKDGIHLSWNQFDAIGIYSDQQGIERYGNPSINEDGAVFRGEKVEGNQFYAFYPYSESATVDSNNRNLLHLSLNDVSGIYRGDYGSGYGSTSNFVAPVVAKSANNDFQFKHIFGYLCLGISNANEVSRDENGNVQSGFTYRKLTLKGNNGEIIAGSGTVDMSADRPVFVLDSDAVKTLISTSDNMYGYWGNGIKLYMTLPEMTFEKGITVTIELNDMSSAFNYNTGGYDTHVIEISTNKPVVIECGKIKNMASLDGKEMFENSESDKVESNIVLSEESAGLLDNVVELPALKTQQIIKFSSSKPWTLALKNTTEGSSDDFYEINPSFGEAGDAEVTITLYANINVDNRKTCFEINDGKKTLDIVFEQRGLTMNDIPEYFTIEDEVPGDMDYGIVYNDGLIYLLDFYEKDEFQPYIPRRVVAYNSDMEESSVVVNYNYSGLPSEIITNDFSIILDNYNLSENTIDATIVYTDGNFEVLKSLKPDNCLEDILADYFNNAQTRSEFGLSAEYLKKITIKFASATLSTVACAAGFSNFITAALALVSCGSALAGWYDLAHFDIDSFKKSKFTQQAGNPFSSNMQTAGVISSLMKCGITKNVGECVSAVASLGLWIADDGLNKMLVKNNMNVAQVQSLKSIYNKSNNNATVAFVLNWDVKKMNLGLSVGNYKFGLFGVNHWGWATNYYGYGTWQIQGGWTVEALESFYDIRNRATTESVINYGFINRGKYDVYIKNEGLYPNIYEYVEDIKYSLGFYVYGKGKIVNGDISASNSGIKHYSLTINDDLSFNIE